MYNYILDRVIIARLLPDGRWDSSFSRLCCGLPPAQQTSSFGSPADPRFPGPQPLTATANLILQPDGVLVLGGAFDAVNTEPRRRLARVDPDGSLRGRLVLRVANDLKLQLPAEVEIPYAIESSTDLYHWSDWLIDDYPWCPADLWLPRGEPMRFFRARSTP